MTELLGDREPRLSLIPDGDADRGDMAVEFARWCGLTLYPWQEDLLRDMCLTRPDGLWSAREVVVPLARQNGKGEVLIARELAGVYLFGEKRILHTAHLMDTAIDAQGRLWDVIESNPDLLYWWGDDPGDVPQLMKSNGKESIEFPAAKARVIFRTRTPKTGRGISIDLLIFDECYDLPKTVYAAMNALIRARPQAQKVFISSPVDRDHHAHGGIFSAKRWAAIDGASRTLFKEWSPPDGADPFVMDSWCAGNPSLVADGAGVQLDDIQSEAEAASSSADLLEVFLVESLGVGRWVPRDGDGDPDHKPVVDLGAWDGLVNRGVVRSGLSCVSVECEPSRDGDGRVWSISAAVDTEVGVHLQLGVHEVLSPADVVERVAKLVKVNDPVAVVMDSKSVARDLVGDLLVKSGVEPEFVTAGLVSATTNGFLQAVDDKAVTHDGDERVREGLAQAQLREVGDAGGVAWSRRAGGQVSHLISMSYALWGLGKFRPEPVAPTPKTLPAPVRAGGSSWNTLTF